jgi:hypothetical protein
VHVLRKAATAGGAFNCAAATNLCNKTYAFATDTGDASGDFCLYVTSNTRSYRESEGGATTETIAE